MRIRERAGADVDDPRRLDAAVDQRLDLGAAGHAADHVLVAVLAYGAGEARDPLTVMDLEEHPGLLIRTSVHPRDLPDELRFTLRPKAAIRKGYREYHSDLLLETEPEYQMGNRIFKFISD